MNSISNVDCIYPASPAALTTEKVKKDMCRYRFSYIKGTTTCTLYKRGYERNKPQSISIQSAAWCVVFRREGPRRASSLFSLSTLMIIIIIIIINIVVIVIKKILTLHHPRIACKLYNGSPLSLVDLSVGWSVFREHCSSRNAFWSDQC